MSYVLKNDQEADRLKRQSTAKSYSVRNELRSINIRPKSKVLEIGCGAGTLISYLNENNQIQANACDLQSEHIKYCQENAQESIHFFQHNIVSCELSEKYDYIFMRLVAHHLGVDTFKLVLENIKKSLKPNGQLIIIDVDDILLGLGTSDKALLDYFSKIVNGFAGDLKMGRKIPLLLKEGGFSNIAYDLQLINFIGEERYIEKSQWQERFEFAKSSFTEALGSELEFSRFKKLYFDTIDDESIPYFMHKITVCGTLD